MLLHAIIVDIVHTILLSGCPSGCPLSINTFSLLIPVLTIISFQFQIQNLQF